MDTGWPMYTVLNLTSLEISENEISEIAEYLRRKDMMMVSVERNSIGCDSKILWNAPES